MWFSLINRHFVSIKLCPTVHLRKISEKIIQVCVYMNWSKKKKNKWNKKSHNGIMNLLQIHLGCISSIIFFLNIFALCLNSSGTFSELSEVVLEMLDLYIKLVQSLSNQKIWTMAITSILKVAEKSENSQSIGNWIFFQFTLKNKLRDLFLYRYCTKLLISKSVLNLGQHLGFDSRLGYIFT